EDDKEHVYIRLDAAAALMLGGETQGSRFFGDVLAMRSLQERLEAVIVLSEVRTDRASDLLVQVLKDDQQDPEIRAGAAWALGEISMPSSLPYLVDGFKALALVIRVEAARALAKLARKSAGAVLGALPSASSEERPGIAWALGKAGGFTAADLIGALVDTDSRHWVSYIIGSQKREAMIG